MEKWYPQANNNPWAFQKHRSKICKIPFWFDSLKLPVFSSFTYQGKNELHLLEIPEIEFCSLAYFECGCGLKQVLRDELKSIFT